MLEHRRFRRFLTSVAAILVIVAGLGLSAGAASAATLRIVGSAVCKGDGTYSLEWLPNPGTTFDPSIAPAVFTKLDGATSFTPASGSDFGAVITSGSLTMTVPGEVAGSYRLTLGYVDALGVLNTVVADVDVDGLCGADAHVVATGPTVTQKCGADNDLVDLPTVTGVTYSAPGWNDGSMTVTATARKGYVLDGESTWTLTDSNEACTTAITPADPTVVEVCGANNDVVTLPDIDGLAYTESGWVKGTDTVTVSTTATHTLTGGTSWTFTDLAAPCPASDGEGTGGTEGTTTGGETTDSDPSDSGELAHTGVDPAPVAGVALALIAAGVVLRRRYGAELS